MAVKKEKETFRDKVAAAFIKSLEEDPGTWVKKWASNETGRPFNLATKRRYNGLNAAYLKFVEKEKGFSDPRWLTYKQAEKAGYGIPKGTKMTSVEYFYMYDRFQKKAISWKEYNSMTPEERNQKVDVTTGKIAEPGEFGTSIKERFLLSSRDHHVFNASQLEGVPEFKFNRVENNISPSEVVDRVATGMGVEIREREQGSAYYVPLTDKIVLPLKSQFKTDYDYQSTALHELSHATGHKSRLDRDQSHEFGSREYAFEELIAEMASCYMGEYVESPMSEEDMRNHSAYVHNWIQEINNDKNYLFKAIKEADKAANFMVEAGKLKELIIDLDVEKEEIPLIHKEIEPQKEMSEEDSYLVLQP